MTVSAFLRRGQLWKPWWYKCPRKEVRVDKYWRTQGVLTYKSIPGQVRMRGTAQQATPDSWARTREVSARELGNSTGDLPPSFHS